MTDPNDRDALTAIIAQALHGPHAEPGRDERGIAQALLNAGVKTAAAHAAALTAARTQALEDLRVTLLDEASSLPETENRDTYLDGYISGLRSAVQRAYEARAAAAAPTPNEDQR